MRRFCTKGRCSRRTPAWDRHVVHALTRLVLDGVEDHLVRQILDLAAEDHRVDRHGPDRHLRVLDDGVARGVEVAARREVHHRVRAPALGPLEFLHLFVRGARHRRGAHVGVDLGLARAADAHGVEGVGEVGPVGGDHQTTGGDLVAHLLCCEVRLAFRDARHLRRHGAEPGVLELRHGAEALGRAIATVGFPHPIGRHEIPGGLVRRGRHARRVRRAIGERRPDARRVGEAARVGARGVAGRVSAARREFEPFLAGHVALQSRRAGGCNGSPLRRQWPFLIPVDVRPISGSRV